MGQKVLHVGEPGKGTALKMLVNSAKEIYATAKQDGLGRKDFSAIYQFMKK